LGGCWQKQHNWGGVGKNNIFGFVFIMKLLSKFNAKQGMNTINLEWKKNKTIKSLRKALL
jgi:hypothetical protein